MILNRLTVRLRPLAADEYVLTRVPVGILRFGGTGIEGVGAPDYGDEGMLQYLRAERIIPPYQTRGYKLVEMVRVYEVGTARRS